MADCVSILPEIPRRNTLKQNSVVFFKSLLWAVFCCSLFACAAGQAARTQQPPLSPFAFSDRYVIAVMPFTFKAEKEEYRTSTSKLEDLVIDQLLKTGRYRVVERSRMAAVLKEISLEQMGIVDGASAGRIGKQLGAELILVGQLTAVKPVGDRDSLGIMYRERKGFEVTLQARLIDSRLGEVVASATASGREVQEHKVALGATTGGLSPDETLFNTAAEKAIIQLVHDISVGLAPNLFD